MAEDKRSFEENLKDLEKLSERLKSADISLDEAIKCFEEGVKCYNICNEKLKTAEQKIQVLTRE